uniref:Uncharacterized protein n=1 Tax=Anguilla anguilla TaxID=7936 RepID=A0A0E9RH76_ANGAN
MGVKRAGLAKSRPHICDCGIWQGCSTETWALYTSSLCEPPSSLDPSSLTHHSRLFRGSSPHSGPG